jgi:hypothetical protein
MLCFQMDCTVMRYLTPEEREALKKRMSEIKVRMEELRGSVTAADLGEWADLYAERKTMEDRLADEE